MVGLHGQKNPDIPYNAHPQINGYVQCGKLKNAYLVAIKAKLVDEVQKISEIAFKAGQLSVRDICEKWLQSNSTQRSIPAR